MRGNTNKVDDTRNPCTTGLTVRLPKNLGPQRLVLEDVRVFFQFELVPIYGVLARLRTHVRPDPAGALRGVELPVANAALSHWPFSWRGSCGRSWAGGS